MGKVFSPLEIQAGIIPEPGAHEAAAHYIVDALLENTTDFFNGNGVQAGMIYGSTAMGSANIRSDVDVLVTYREQLADKALPAIRWVFRHAERRFNVPVEANILPVGATFSPLEHAIDPLFAEHLIDIQNQDEPRWSYGWPVDGLGIDPRILTEDTIRKLAIRYCSAKSRRLTRGLVEYDGGPDYKHLQRALELPAAIGRKVLAVVYGSAHVSQAVLQDKYNATGQVARLFDTITEKGWDIADSKQRFLELANLDSTYNDILGDALDGKLTHSAYGKYLSSSYEATLLLGIRVAQSWVHILDDKLDQRDLGLETLAYEDQITSQRQALLEAGIDPDDYSVY